MDLQLICNEKELQIGAITFQLEKYLRVNVFKANSGSKVFNTTLPATKINHDILGYQARLLNQNVPDNYKVQIRYRGNTVVDGIMLIKQASRTGYEVSIGFSNGEFYYHAKDKKLSECTYDDITYTNTVLAKGRPRSDSFSGVTEVNIDFTDSSDPSNLIYNGTSHNSYISIPSNGWYFINYDCYYTNDIFIPCDLRYRIVNTTQGKEIATRTVKSDQTVLSIGVKNFYANSGDVIEIKVAIISPYAPPSTFNCTFISGALVLCESTYLTGLLSANQYNYPLSKFATFPVRNEVYGAGSALYSSVTYQNQLYVDKGGGTYDWDRTHVYPITPFFFLAEIVKKAVESVGWTLDYNWLALHDEYKTITVYNNVDVNGMVDFIFAPTPTLVLNAKNHVPDITVWELIQTLVEGFNLIPVYDEANKRLRLEDGKRLPDVERVEEWEFASQDYIKYFDQTPPAYKIVQSIEQDDFATRQFELGAADGWRINSSVATPYGLPQTDAVGSLRQALSDGQWYIKTGNANWQLFSTVIPAYITGTDAQEITQKWMSVYMTGYQPISTNTGDEQLYCPRVEIVGRSEYHTNVPEVLKNLRLLFYRGEVDCVTNTSTAIPFGSSTPAKMEQPSGVTLQSGKNCSLWLESEHFKANSGIIAQRFAKTIEWLAKIKPVEIYVPLDAAAVKNTDQFTKYRYGKALVTVESLETDISNSGVSISTIKGFTTP